MSAYSPKVKQPVTQSRLALAKTRVDTYRKWLRRDAEITQMSIEHDHEWVRNSRRDNPMPELPASDDWGIADGRTTHI